MEQKHRRGLPCSEQLTHRYPSQCSTRLAGVWPEQRVVEALYPAWVRHIAAWQIAVLETT
eukprot:SAG31_NODE_40602_length_280_cov_0.569061_1_plen_59_part_10